MLSEQVRCLENKVKDLERQLGEEKRLGDQRSGAKQRDNNDLRNELRDLNEENFILKQHYMVREHASLQERNDNQAHLIGELCDDAKAYKVVITTLEKANAERWGETQRLDSQLIVDESIIEGLNRSLDEDARVTMLKRTVGRRDETIKVLLKREQDKQLEINVLEATVRRLRCDVEQDTKIKELEDTIDRLENSLLEIKNNEIEDLFARIAELEKELAQEKYGAWATWYEDAQIKKLGLHNDKLNRNELIEGLYRDISGKYAQIQELKDANLR